MVTLKPGINAASGFTLLEMLVVLLIVGLMAGALMTNIKISSGKQLQREAENLAWLLRHKAVESRASGQAIIWRPVPSGYVFLREVKPNQPPAVAETHTLPENIKISAIQGAEALPLEAIRLSGRRISGLHRITLSNQEESIEVNSEGFDLFSVSAKRSADTHGRP